MRFGFALKICNKYLLNEELPVFTSLETKDFKLALWRQNRFHLDINLRVYPSDEVLLN